MTTASSSIRSLTPEPVAELCFDKFKSLPKTGKPNQSMEWTVLAGVVMHNSSKGTSEVVSLGCGTKCIGKSKLSPTGLILNDSHAEVLSRRALLRYFYHHIQETFKGNDDTIFAWLPDKRKCKLKENITFHFLSTQTPCGDACIIEKRDQLEAQPANKKAKMETTSHEEASLQSIDNVYTGAKLLDLKHPDPIEQIVGAVRTKPGRGERTLSMSCSDKLAKWQVIGVQGALLDMLLDNPIYFETLNFSQSDCHALERAIWKRFTNNQYNNKKYCLHMPEIRTCNMEMFPYNQDDNKQPSPNGLVWCNIPDYLKPYEISVNGKRQGVTSKKLNTPQAALAVSKYKLFQLFLETVELKSDLWNIYKHLGSMTYLDVKHLSLDYQIAWNDLKAMYFKQWTHKSPDLLAFFTEAKTTKSDQK